MAFAARLLQTKTGRLTFAGFALAFLVVAALILLWPPATNAPAGHTAGTRSAVPADVRVQIDRWIDANRLNQYGDAPDTMYAGGNPLFDPQTGKSRDRYEYILEKHPELRDRKGP